MTRLRLALTLVALAATAQTPPPPTLELAFTAQVTIAPSVNLGQTPFGGRNYIPITGGTVDGPRLKGRVVPGGWDWQLHLPNGCTTLTADYFLQAEDGALIKVLNKATSCPGGKLYTRPVFEAPKGPHEWLNSAVLVGALEVVQGGVRIRFYQVK